MAGPNRAGVIKFTHVPYRHDARSPAHQPVGRTGPLTQGGERPVTRRRCDGVGCVAPRSFAIAQLIVGLITTAAVREPWLGAGAGSRVAGGRGGHGRGGRCRGRAPGGAVSGTGRRALRIGLARVGRTIRDMIGRAGTSRPAGFLAEWARWAALAVFTVFVAIGLGRMNPSAVAAAAAAVVAVAAGALLAWQRRPLLVYAAVATGGIAVLGHGMPSNVGWFAVCLLGAWCGLIGGRRDGLVYGAAALALFAAEWLWVRPDPGWGAWMAGVTLSVVLGLLIRQQLDLVAQLREAQAGLAERARAEERNRIGRELHDVIAHTLTVVLLHITSARLAVEHDPADAARALAEAERLGRDSLDEVRLAVGMLHEQGDGGRTTPLPGVDVLPALVERFRSTGADVSLTVDGDLRRLHAATGLAVYRILQEALTNAVKHAGGAPAAVTLTVDTDTVRLAVDSAAEPRTGAGLGVVSMRERAESLGGSCQAGPGGRGWLVAATLPLASGWLREDTT